MGNLWLKIKVWTKVAVFAFLLLYVLAFIFKNSDEKVKIWYWFFRPKYEWPVLFLTFLVFAAGVLGTILVSTSLKTLRQIRELQARVRADRLEREVAEMKSKAAMLKPKPAAETTPVTPAASAHVADDPTLPDA